MAYALRLARQPKELFRELDQPDLDFLRESIERALTAIAAQQLKPSLEPSYGYVTVYLEECGYVMTCKILAPGEQGARSGDEAIIARLKPIIGPPPY